MSGRAGGIDLDGSEGAMNQLAESLSLVKFFREAQRSQRSVSYVRAPDSLCRASNQGWRHFYVPYD
jgi:hypothetical protein